MSIEAGLCKYAELNDKIKQELRTKKKVTIKKLKKKKTYYIKARAYKLDGKTKVYGRWSLIRKVTIKK